MNAPPDWQDGDCCYRCRTQFSVVARKHHCRNCGNIFCARCSSQQIPLPKLNIEKNVRVCDTCYEKITGRADQLALALGTNDKDAKREQQTTKPKTHSDSKSSSLSAKAGPGASAPSEQELKEEEELQLALALSLSETPVKVSFPDYKHLEDSSHAGPSKPSSNANVVTSIVSSEPAVAKLSNVNNQADLAINQDTVSNQLNSKFDPTNSYSIASNQTSSNMIKQQSSQQAVSQQSTVQSQMQPEYPIQDRDQELFRYIGEVHGLLEVFNNRLEACKLRNRPVANDAAIQSLFIKLNSEIQPKLATHIKTYEDEREIFERLQDKLSQITDARAALDALREEHQEKLRQLAAEAEKQRQNQLASKLEAMRQKKTQMMQYQRELAMQRIREQEMVYQSQPTSDGHTAAPQEVSVQSANCQIPYQQPIVHQQGYEQSMPQQSFVPAQSSIQTLPSQGPNAVIAQQAWSKEPTQTIQYQQPYATADSLPATHASPNRQPMSSLMHQYMPYIPQQQAPTSTQSSQPTIDRAAIVQLEKQFLPDAKPDEEAPLISFDD